MTEIVSLPRQAVRARFVWILPALFAAAGVLGAAWPGHGGQLFCIGALAGIWACLLVDGSGGPATWLAPTLAGGVPILFFLGRLLDRLQVDLRVWLLAMLLGTAASGFVLLQGFSDIEQAIVHHGSFLAYCICALQIGGYAATLLVLVIGTSRSGRG